jgi:hypothetical protein
MLTGEFSLLALPGAPLPRFHLVFLQAQLSSGPHPSNRARLSAGMTYYSWSPHLRYVVELRGFEPLTSSVRLMRSPD